MQLLLTYSIYKMRCTIIFGFILCIVMTSCDNEGDSTNSVPMVTNAATSSVFVQSNIIYGEGLAHDSLNSDGAIAVSLLMDIYEPEEDIDNRPLFMFIHGGGFTGGSKTQAQILNFAEYFSSRGWVFVSVNYRLRDNFGTTPQEWVSFSEVLPTEDVRSQFLAIYPAIRDAKAALRFLVANAGQYKINTDYITVGGGSAGAISSVALGVSELEDYKDELDPIIDPTTTVNNPTQTYEVHSIIDLWGSDLAVDALESIYGLERFDSSDPPIMIVHGTQDTTVLFTEAEDLRDRCITNNIPFAFFPIEGAGHAAWNATVDGDDLERLTFEFIVEQQGLIVE